MDDEIWEGDEFGDPLPVLDGQEPPPTAPSVARRRRRTPWSPRGGVKAGSVAGARRQALAEATGNTIDQPEQWRDELSMGNRGRASASIESGGRSHGGSGGFGLA